MQRQFTREIESLEEVFDFLHQFMTLHCVGEETMNDIDLVVEELFTNMVKYSPTSRESIAIDLQKAQDLILVSLVDPNSEPFDITKAPEVDVNLPLSDRSPGGLGIFLVKKLTDSVQYEHQDGKSIITVTKRLE